MPRQAVDGLGVLHLGTVPGGVHLDPGALLLHVVLHAPNQRRRVVDRERGPARQPTLVEQVIRPLVAVVELKVIHGIGAIDRFRLGRDLQPLGALEEYLFVGLGFRVHTGSALGNLRHYDPIHDSDDAIPLKLRP